MMGVSLIALIGSSHILWLKVGDMSRAGHQSLELLRVQGTDTERCHCGSKTNNVGEMEW